MLEVPLINIVYPNVEYLLKIYLSGSYLQINY